MIFFGVKKRAKSLELRAKSLKPITNHDPSKATIPQERGQSPITNHQSRITKKAFTLIEMIFVIVIMGILSVGTFSFLNHIYKRSAKTKIITDLSFSSQVVVDQISALLYERIPLSVIGYKPSDRTFVSIYDLDGTYPVLEWIGYASEALKAGEYSGFVDMDASDRDTNTLHSFSIANSELNTTEYKKFGIAYNYNSPNDANVTAIIFSGSFDDGSINSDFNNSFGWHGHDHNFTYDITKIDSSSNITLAKRPQAIYEKYYLADSAYAIARGENINQTVNCIKDLNISNDDINNTLFLFYNYRPWKGETFCADVDDNKGKREGNATVLSYNVGGFKSGLINNSIYFELTTSKRVKGTKNDINISKQKVLF